MGLSARNQLPGVVEEVRLGDVMAHVVVRVGANIVESVITRTSADELGLKKGDAVRVVVKKNIRRPTSLLTGGSRDWMPISWV